VKAARIVLSEMAIADILEQADWYESQLDSRLAVRWEKAVTAVLLRISQRPATGKLCKFQSDELAGTRRAPVSRFSKHLIFYQVYEREVFVLRVVHGARDLESLFSGESESPR
jgi:toxin ParE1/3/4